MSSGLIRDLRNRRKFPRVAGVVIRQFDFTAGTKCEPLWAKVSLCSSTKASTDRGYGCR